jgi:hypothetical protein
MKLIEKVMQEHPELSKDNILSKCPSDFVSSDYDMCDSDDLMEYADCKSCWDTEV